MKSRLTRAWVTSGLLAALLFAANVAARTGDTHGARLTDAARAKAGSYEIHTRHRTLDGLPEYTNDLILETSPYLLQHAHQPVQWRTWSDAARKQAKAARRPIFLSIGYSTCHWCQVMARESFDDLGIARLLNGYYVSIKVDREEHPALDEHYLQRLEVLTGSPGWPANFILTPRGEVIAAASYLKRDALAQMLSQYARAWTEDPRALRQRASAVEKQLAGAPRPRSVDLAAAAKKADAYRWTRFDERFPGFDGEPRFFHTQFLEQHLASWKTSGKAEDLRRFLSPLRQLLRSATHDLVSGGFFRYSVSGDGNRPHFEKLLLDQALLLPLLAEAWAITGETEFRDAAIDLLALLRREWTVDAALLAAGQDASGNGQEGHYYLFGSEERAALGGEVDAAVFWHPLGDGALPTPRPPHALAAAMRQELARLRAKKMAPPLDRKVVTAWNAAFFAAAAQAAPLLGLPELSNWAAQGMKRLLQVNRRGVELTRYSLQGEARGRASVEDHAYVLLALARLYEADGSPAWMEEAEACAKQWSKPHALLQDLRNVAIDRGAPSAAAVWVQAVQALGSSGRAPRVQALARRLTPDLESLAAQSPQRHGALVARLTQGAGRAPSRVAYLAEGQVQALLRPRRGSGATEIELELRIAPGWHINSGEPYQKYLRPTRLRLRQENSGQLTMTYPKGEDQRLGDETLSLYSGTVTLRGHLQAPLNAHLPLELQVQACSDQVCLAPEVVVLHP